MLPLQARYVTGFTGRDVQYWDGARKTLYKPTVHRLSAKGVNDVHCNEARS